MGDGCTGNVSRQGVTDLGCKVSCVPVLMTGPHWTHSGSGILTGLPRRPAGSALGSPILPFLQPRSVFCPQTLRRGPPSGLVPAPPQISAGPAALFLSGLCQNVSLVDAPAPPSVEITTHHPCRQPCLTPSHASSGQTAHTEPVFSLYLLEDASSEKEALFLICICPWGLNHTWRIADAP